MQPARLADELVAGSQVKMVGIAEYDLRTGVEQVSRRQCFDRALRSHRHKNGRLNFAMVGQDPPCPGFPAVVDMFECKEFIHHGVSRSSTGNFVHRILRCILGYLRNWVLATFI